MSAVSKHNNRKPYNGEHRGLAIAFDVGTTFSGLARSVLKTVLCSGTACCSHF